MARPLLVLSLLSRLGLSPTPSKSCRFASRAAVPWIAQRHVRSDRAANRAPGRRDEMSGEDDGGYQDPEDPEDKIQGLVVEGRKKKKTVKYHMLRRQMTATGAPQRKLTWDAMQQIRYLKQEQPEEWTVERLAEGFSVSHDVILRVLRSKFIPAPERIVRQDAKVMARLSQQALPSGAVAGQNRLKLSRNNTAALLPSGRGSGALISATEQSLMIRGERSGSLTKSPAPVIVLPSQLTAGIRKDVTVPKSTEDDSPTSTSPTEDDTEEEERWDGLVFTDEELEEYVAMEKPPPVVQVGNDFFDAEGNFIYRL